MLFVRIVILSVFFCSYIQASDFLSEDAKQLVVSRMAAKGIDDSSVIALEEMRSIGGLLLSADDERVKKAADMAFWVHYCNLKLQQVALPNSEGKVLFPNLLELIRDDKSTVVNRLILENDESEKENLLNIAFLKFCIACEFIFLNASEIDEELLKNTVWFSLTAESAKCKEWFIKVLQSKDGAVPQGRSILIGRLVQIADFLSDIAASNEMDKVDQVRSMLGNNIIANADDCPDRAISGLDDLDFDIGLFHTPTIESVIHFLLRQYKKHIIQECLVEHQFSESAQEYVYLLSLLNDHFNLGLCSVGILSGEVGARKTFDVAARMLMDNISIDGFCHFIAKNVPFRSFLCSMIEHKDIMDEAAADPDRVEDTLYAYVLRIVEPYICANFVIENEKFQELKAADVEILESFLDGEAA